MVYFNNVIFYLTYTRINKLSVLFSTKQETPTAAYFMQFPSQEY